MSVVQQHVPISVPIGIDSVQTCDSQDDFGFIDTAAFQMQLEKDEAENAEADEADRRAQQEGEYEDEDEDEDEDEEQDEEEGEEDDGELIDDSNSATASRPAGVTLLPIGPNGEITSARRSSCIGSVPSLLTVVGDKRKALVGVAGRVARKGVKFDGTAGVGVGEKKLKSSTSSSLLNGARPHRTQSVGCYLSKPLLTKSVSNANLPTTSSTTTTATTTTHKPMGFGCAGSTTMNGLFGDAPNNGTNNTTRSGTSKTTLKDATPLTSRGGKDKENALEVASNGSQTSRVRTEVKSRFMVSNYSHATNVTHVIEKAIVKPKAVKEVSEKSSTSTDMKVVQQTSGSLTSRPVSNKRRSIDMATIRPITATTTTTTTTNGKRRSAAISTDANADGTTTGDVNSGVDSSSSSPAKKAKHDSAESDSQPIELDAAQQQALDEQSEADAAAAASHAKLIALTVERVTLQNDVSKLEATLSEKDEHISTLESREIQLRTELSDLRQSLQEARQAYLESSEAETSLRPLRHENESLKEDVKKLRGQLEQARSDSTRELKGYQGLVTQNYQLQKRVKELEKKLHLNGVTTSTTAPSSEWTSGESMKWDTASTLEDGRRATVAPSMSRLNFM